MAVVSVSFDGTRLSDAESLTPANGSWTDSGGTAAVLETDTVYQGSSSVSEKVKTTELGVGFVATTAVDFTTPRTALFKIIVTTTGTLSDTSSTAGIIEIGSGGRRVNYYRYYIVRKSTYVPTGGWLIIPIDPNVSGYPDATVTAAPTLTALNWYGFVATMSVTTAKAENIAMDAIDYMTVGTGLTLIGGDSTDTDGTFQNFATFDEGTTTNRYGICTTKNGVFYIAGVLTIGTATATVFTDSNQTVVFPDARVSAGFCGIDLGLQNASNVISITSVTFVGKGRKGYGDFDTTGDVNGTTEVITTNQPHNFNTGDAATYSKQGGTANIGLTDATVYYINAISTTTLYVYDTKVNADAGGATGRQNLTAAGAETHSLTRTTDSRPDLGVTSTTGSATFTSCTFNGFNASTLTSTVTLSKCTFNSCQSLTQSSATISNCTFNSSTTAPGVAFMTSNNPANISSSTFVIGNFGHAIEITTASTYTFSGNTFTSYGPTVFGFHTTNDVNSTNDTVTKTGHGYSTGNAIRYMKQGGTANMGLTDNTTYYVRAIDINTLAFYASENNASTDVSRINLTATGTETHYINSLNAAIYNNSAGAVTINVTGGGTSPSVRNGSSASTTVNANVNVNVHVQNSSQTAIQNARVYVYKTSDGTVIINGVLTNASGDVQGSTAAGTGGITIRVRKSSTGTTRYFPSESSGGVGGSDFSTTVTLNTDTIVEP